MAAAPDYLSLQQFEQLYGNEKPSFEYWFGEAVQKSMPTLLHGMVQWIVAMLLARRDWSASTEVRLKVSAVAHPVPDLVANRCALVGPYPTSPFDLCVEILSPGDNLRQVFSKAAHYLDWGIETVWVIDPERRKAYHMSGPDPNPIEIGIDGTLLAGSGEAFVEIPLAEIFSEVDKNRQGK